MLSQSHPEWFESSTIVSLQLAKPLRDDLKIEVSSSLVGVKDIFISFDDYISTVVSGLDVEVKLKINDGVMTTIHEPIQVLKISQNKRRWLETISYAGYLDVPAREYTASNADRLREIYSDGVSWGFAALSTAQNLIAPLGRKTIGGLSTNIHGLMADSFIGCVEFLPSSAKRDASVHPAAPKDVLRKWADEQVDLLKNAKVDLLSWCAATVSLFDLGLDPIDTLHCLFNQSGNIIIADLRIIYDMLKTTGIAILKSTIGEAHVEINSSIVSYEHYLCFVPTRNSGFLTLTIDDSLPKYSNSFLGCLWRYTMMRGEVLDVEVRSGIGVSILRMAVDVMIIKIVPSATADAAPVRQAKPFA